MDGIKLQRYDGDDFCLIHGRDHMFTVFGNPISACGACLDDAVNADNADGVGTAKSAMANFNTDE